MDRTSTTSMRAGRLWVGGHLTHWVVAVSHYRHSGRGCYAVGCTYIVEVAVESPAKDGVTPTTAEEDSDADLRNGSGERPRLLSWPWRSRRANRLPRRQRHVGLRRRAGHRRRRGLDPRARQDHAHELLRRLSLSRFTRGHVSGQ